MKDEHVKDAAQGLAQDVAEYVLGVAENGSVKELAFVNVDHIMEKHGNDPRGKLHLPLLGILGVRFGPELCFLVIYIFSSLNLAMDSGTSADACAQHVWPTAYRRTCAPAPHCADQGSQGSARRGFDGDGEEEEGYGPGAASPVRVRYDAAT